MCHTPAHHHNHRFFPEHCQCSNAFACRSSELCLVMSVSHPTPTNSNHQTSQPIHEHKSCTSAPLNCHPSSFVLSSRFRSSRTVTGSEPKLPNHLGTLYHPSCLARTHERNGTPSSLLPLLQHGCVSHSLLSVQCRVTVPPQPSPNHSYHAQPVN